VEEEAEPMLFKVEEGVESERDRRLSSATDRLRTRFGKGAVMPARIAPKPKPQAKE